MKKQLVILMLSATFFTSPPLFAMEELKDHEKIFARFPKEMICHTLVQLPAQEILPTFSHLCLTSKEMYSYFHSKEIDSYFWEPFAQKVFNYFSGSANNLQESDCRKLYNNCKLESNQPDTNQLGIKKYLSFFKEGYFSLFTKERKTYSVPLAFLMDCLRTPLSHKWLCSRNHDFTLENQEFYINNKIHNKIDPNNSMTNVSSKQLYSLEDLSPETLIYFTYKKTKFGMGEKEEEVSAEVNIPSKNLQHHFLLWKRW